MVDSQKRVQKPHAVEQKPVENTLRISHTHRYTIQKTSKSGTQSGLLVSALSRAVHRAVHGQRERRSRGATYVLAPARAPQILNERNSYAGFHRAC